MNLTLEIKTSVQKCTKKLFLTARFGLKVWMLLAFRHFTLRALSEPHGQYPLSICNMVPLRNQVTI